MNESSNDFSSGSRELQKVECSTGQNHEWTHEGSGKGGQKDSLIGLVNADGFSPLQEKLYKSDLDRTEKSGFFKSSKVVPRVIFTRP